MGRAVAVSAIARGWRGANYYQLRNYNAAIEDLNKSIELNPDYSYTYYYRGLAKKYTKDIIGSCNDLKQALDLGYTFAADDLKANGCQ